MNNVLYLNDLYKEKKKRKEQGNPRIQDTFRKHLETPVPVSC